MKKYLEVMGFNGLSSRPEIAWAQETLRSGVLCGCIMGLFFAPFLVIMERISDSDPKVFLGCLAIMLLSIILAVIRLTRNINTNYFSCRK